MHKNLSKYTDEEMLKFLIRDIKKLGKIIPSANFGRKIILTSEEIEKVSKETGIEAYKIYMKYG